MRTRAVREGSAGLLIILGLGLLAGLFLWLRGLRVGERSYNVVIEFPRVNGLQEGAAVRYRGVGVGRIAAIRPKTNRVEVVVEISPANLIMSKNVLVEANQSGFLGEVSVDITPDEQLQTQQVTALPLDPNCDRNLIVCNNSRLQGQIGVSTDELIRFSTRFASVYSNEQLYKNVSDAARNASIAAAGVSDLTRELANLTRATRSELKELSATANSVQKSVEQVSASTTATSNQFRLTAAQANRLLANLDNLVTTNRSSLVSALNNLSQTSQQLRSTVNNLTPTLNRVNQGELIENLETLTANAAQASANLRDVSNALNSPTNLLTLQQTLDSARVTFQNAQKITSDLDELTGDPTFRTNIRDLIDGLSGLVSSTQQLQQQVEVAQTLDSVKAAMKNPKNGTFTLSPNAQAILKSPDNNQQPQWLLQLKASSSSKQ